MKKEEKKRILILIVISIIIIGCICLATRTKNQDENIKNQNEIVEEYLQVLSEGNKINTSTKLKETKVINGLEFSNIRLVQKNGQSILLADVRNNTGIKTETILLDVILLDKQGNEIVKLSGAVAPLEVGQEKQFQVNSTLDYTNAYDFKIEIKD